MTAGIHQIYHEHGMKILQPYFVSVSTELNPELREAKAKKNAENIIKALYLTFSSIISLYYLNQGNYLPVMMGGISSSNHISRVYASYPLINHVRGIKEFYLVLSGYHLSGTIRHLKTPVEKRKNDYIEMCLHHLLTVSLFCGGYIMNDIEPGIITSFLMDFCDIWVHFAKGFVDTKFKSTCTVFGVFMWFFWGYTRLYCFPYFIYMVKYSPPFSEPLNMQGTPEGHIALLITCLLSILGIMGIWWWYLISKMVFTALSKGKVRDI